MSDFQKRLAELQSSSKARFEELNSAEHPLSADDIALLRMLGWEKPEDTEDVVSGWLVAIMKWDSSTWSTKSIFNR